MSIGHAWHDGNVSFSDLCKLMMGSARKCAQWIVEYFGKTNDIGCLFVSGYHIMYVIYVCDGEMKMCELVRGI